jgi:hypothetical protein
LELVVAVAKALWIWETHTDNSSDADTDVLADYVTALVAGDEPEASFRRNCIESLQDFLRDSKHQQGDSVNAMIM